MKFPDTVAINHDDYHASCIGHLADGRQFFLTQPFDPLPDLSDVAEFLALYVFDRAGALLEARIEDLGMRSSLDAARCAGLKGKWLAELGQLSYGRIEIAPFSVERYGRRFGLIACDLDDLEDENDLSFSMLPGDVMAFYAPFDSGDYDT